MDHYKPGRTWTLGGQRGDRAQLKMSLMSHWDAGTLSLLLLYQVEDQGPTSSCSCSLPPQVGEQLPTGFKVCRVWATGFPRELYALLLFQNSICLVRGRLIILLWEGVSLKLSLKKEEWQGKNIPHLGRKPTLWGQQITVTSSTSRRQLRRGWESRVSPLVLAL